MTTLQRNATHERRTGTSDQLRRTATIVGWLFIVTYVTSIASKVALYPPLFEGNYVTGPGEDTRVLWGALSEAILIISGIGSATALYAVIKRQHPNLAISFVAARVMEAVFVGAGILSVLTVVTMRQDYAGTVGEAAAGLTVVGDALIALQEWTFCLGPGFVVGVGNGLILGYIMYRTGLVPRRLAMLGLIGGPLIILSGSAAMMGFIELDGTWQTVAAIPEFFWELGFGVYLIVKGFRTTPGTDPSTAPSTAPAGTVDVR